MSRLRNFILNVCVILMAICLALGATALMARQFWVPDHVVELRLQTRTAHRALERAIIILDQNGLLDDAAIEWILEPVPPVPND